MLLTEKEAMQRWCPFSRARRHGYGTAVAVNRDASDAQHTLCLASACMAWRWADSATEKSMSRDRPEGEGWELSDFPAAGKWRRPVVNRRGFCGLAGEVRP